MRKIETIATWFAASIAGFALFTASPALGAEQFEGVLETKTLSKEMRILTRTHVCKAGVRVEMTPLDDKGNEAKGEKAQGMPVMIVNAKEPKRFYVVDEGSKSFMSFDTTEMEKQTPTDERKYFVEKQGSDKVAGLKCEKALVREEGKENEGYVEYCIAKLDAAFDLDMASRGGKPVDNLQRALQKAGLKGFPVRVRQFSKEEKEPIATTELVKLDKREVPASSVQVPEGYTEIKMPSMGDMGKALGSAAGDAAKESQEAAKKEAKEKAKKDASDAAKKAVKGGLGKFF